MLHTTPRCGSSCALTSPARRDAANTADTTLTICPAAGATPRQLPEQALKLGDPSDPGNSDHGQAAQAAQRVTPASPGPEPEQNKSSPGSFYAQGN